MGLRLHKRRNTLSRKQVLLKSKINVGGAGRDKDMKRQTLAEVKNQKKKTHKKRQFRAVM